jgi:DNA mismatch endonuclease, patch repair protein
MKNYEKKVIIREKMSVYLGKAPKASSAHVTKSMKSNTAQGTRPELKLRKALSNKKIKGYRLNHKHIPGRPDIVFTKKKLAVFINGCYWHRCPKCRLSLPKTNTIFWKNKFIRNKTRDRLKTRRLRALGWELFDPCYNWTRIKEGVLLL